MRGARGQRQAHAGRRQRLGQKKHKTRCPRLAPWHLAGFTQGWLWWWWRQTQHRWAPPWAGLGVRILYAAGGCLHAHSPGGRPAAR